MSEENRCPECGVPLPAHAPQGLCPSCLLKRGVETTPPASEAGQASGGFTPPTPPQLAALFPDLEILEFIGRGGMGLVYKARQRHLNRLVALKILLPNIARDPAFAERFTREARAMAMLSHPHIVTVYDFGQTTSPLPLAGEGQGVRAAESEGMPYAPLLAGEGQGVRAAGGEGVANLPSPSGRGAGGEGGLFCFLMEFVDGLTLRQLLDAGKLAPQEALAIVPQICEALQYAHDKGVVHRDIKPENILMDRSGQVKIADFGLAKLVGRAAQDFSLTGAGQVMGTPHYMAPEQVEHPLQVDHRADIYSLGVVFYQMLTGELPIGRFAPPSKKVQIDVRLDEVVLRALEKEPSLRYQQASEVKTEVEAISATAAGPPFSRPAKIVPPTPPTGTAAGVENGGPRFSRTAIAGAAWAPLFFVLAIAGFFSNMHVQVSAGSEPPGPEWRQWVLIFTVLPLGLLAPFGTTILGAVAMAQIRHSAGRLYGLALALFDTLFFPLLVLDGLIGWLWWFVSDLIRQAIVYNAAGKLLSPAAMTFIANQTQLVLWVTVLTSALVDFFLVRWAWRAASKPLRGPPPSPSGSAADSSGTGRAALASVAIFLAAMSGILGIASFFFWPAPPPILVWSILAAAVLGIVLAIPSRKIPLGKKAIVGGSINMAIWLFVAVLVHIFGGMPSALRLQSTRQLIERQLPDHLDEPWVWDELQSRLQAGSLSQKDVGTAVKILIAHLAATQPEGLTQPLVWKDGFLGMAVKAGMISLPVLLDLCDAVYGPKPVIRLPRWREGKTDLQIQIQHGNVWSYQTNRFLGVELLWQVERVLLDGKPIEIRHPMRMFSGEEWAGTYPGPLKAGDHQVVVEVQCAYVDSDKLIGLNGKDVAADRWPETRKRWKQSATAPLKVYTASEPIVALVTDAGQSPGPDGGIRIDRFVAQADAGGKKKLILKVEFTTNSSPSLSLSYDVAAAIEGEPDKIGLGPLWIVNSGERSNQISTSQVDGSIGRLDPAIHDADIILTPNPAYVEQFSEVSEIWGKKVILRGIPLERLDLTSHGASETRHARGTAAAPAINTPNASAPKAEAVQVTSSSAETADQTLAR